MKKIRVIIIAILVVFIAVFMLTACTEIIEGKSAYDLAVELGYEGTLEEWLESLKGTDGSGKSAYEIALENGFEGSESDWLESLKGVDGRDGAAVDAGKSAYEIAVDNGFVGSVDAWLESLKGADGTDGEKGKDGRDGINGLDSEYLSVSYAANKAILSSVLVYCEFEKSGITTTSAGSGIIMEEDKENGNAYIATNYHVVFDAAATTQISDKIEIYLFGMQMERYAIEATYIGGSMTFDIAVLKIENSDIYKDSAARAVEINNNTTHYVGDTAIAIGNPQGSGISVTAGIVGVDSEHIDMKGADGVTNVRFRVLRIDTAVNSGNSGGGLFNAAGQLIGMVNAKIISANVENIGYAIPLSTVVSAYNNILRNCDGIDNIKIKRCLLGIEIAAIESYAYYNEDTFKTEVVEKVEVKTVSESGAAYGLLEEGDIILSFTYDGVEIMQTRTFIVVDYSLNFVHNETLTLTIERDGVVMDVDIPLINVIEID